MGYCDGLIVQGIEPDCENPISRGIEANGIIINRKDIDFSSVVLEPDSASGNSAIKGRKNVIQSFSLRAGAKGYKVYVPTLQPFNGTNTTMEAGTNRNTFTNNLGFLILDNGPDVCENVIDALASGEFVVIFENKFKNINKSTTPGDSTFQIMGWYQGLKATTIENDKYSEDTDGGWNVVLTETRVSKSGMFLYHTDIETTRSQLESLTA